MNARALDGKVIAKKATPRRRVLAGCAKFNISASARCHAPRKLSVFGRQMSSLPDFLFERISAEIHQQMDGVLALADQLGRHALSGEAQACAAGVVQAAASVQRILSRATDLRGAEAGGLTLQPEPRSLRDLMDEIQAAWQVRAADNGVTLLVAYDGDPEACAQVDGARLIQLFDGLIGQAVAGVRRGAVEASLRVASRGEELLLEGRVRGGGDRSGDLDAADAQDIEARYGLETALGVALGRKIIQAFGGGDGGGELEDDGLAGADAAEPDDTLATRSAHVLVVDDNATNRMVAQTLCEMFDCTSETACNGEEAVEAARTGRFDLILMDIKMPRMDGVAATRMIRALPGRLGRVPIIALTANADPEDAAGYVTAGMNGVVEKPMKPENLLQALQQALGDASAAEAA
jgi:CheY-like chemotaxis protein